jgi:hypothetical protein
VHSWQKNLLKSSFVLFLQPSKRLKCGPDAECAEPAFVKQGLFQLQKECKNGDAENRLELAYKKSAGSAR